MEYKSYDELQQLDIQAKLDESERDFEQFLMKATVILIVLLAIIAGVLVTMAYLLLSSALL